MERSPFLTAVLRAFISSALSSVPFFSASSSFCLASMPSDIAVASEISSSADSSDTLPISLRYIRTGSSVEKLSTSSFGSTSSSSSISAISSIGGSISSMLLSMASAVPMSIPSVSSES